MKLNLLWMYHDIMDLYGDKGNIEVLKKRCLDRNIDIQVDTCGIGEGCDFTKYHLVFIGGGADYEQQMICNDLLSRKANIEDAMNANTFFLLVCGGYQFFGQYYINNQNTKMDALGIFEYYSESASVGRCIGNIIIQSTLDGKEVEIVGFENHGGQSKQVRTPLGKVVFGHGNEYQGGFEGFLSEQVLATYIHGPLLPKNPEVADYVIQHALEKTYDKVELLALDDTLELQAKQAIIDAIKKNNR